MSAGPNPYCTRRGKWIRGCHYEPRYDEAPGTPADTQGDRDFTVSVLQAAKVRIYVRDVCRTCGRTIERAPTDHPGAAA
ncbi:hypothetical protein LOK46_10800 [Methylobacterium sp. NMS14P]|uniref:hypothetical protein n=1 Tax=Methylobacterium sp. NMS14P TaxID=2894310 RepID=UPI00235A18FA|nr:hypothetical protein [Methylobacterium sp. NMS14P]WCS27279.1 hypothetical protein LOK46_10800 [Methylobacterium sp. NMS14P]